MLDEDETHAQTQARKHVTTFRLKPSGAYTSQFTENTNFFKVFFSDWISSALWEMSSFMAHILHYDSSL